MYATVLLATALLPSAHARTLWSSTPAADWSDLIRTAFPVGNGQLGVLPFGVPGQEKLNLNKDDLWSGGPFETANYTGGNPAQSATGALSAIQQQVFETGVGNITGLAAGDDFGAYGSYAVLGNVTITMSGVGNYTAYNRSLDLSTGLHTTTFTSGPTTYTTQVYCSFPDSVCVYDISSTRSLPALSIAFEDTMRDVGLSKPACAVDQGVVSIRGQTQADIGMTFFAAAKAVGSDSTATCSDSGALMVTPAASRLTLVIAAGTDYDQKNGNAEAGYSFKGEDPEAKVQGTVAAAAAKSADDLQTAHVADFVPLMSGFELNLADTKGSIGLETSAQLDKYDNTAGDPYFEAQQFDYGRYLFLSSSREGSLPPNLQGKWAYGLTNAWSADYHVDVNLQMNHWGVEETGLGGLQDPLWNYMVDTWTSRGADTAKLTYGGEGWVVHGYLNTFGSTGLPQGDDYWTLLTGSNAWMMLHSADHFEFSQDTDWLSSTGYPALIKPVAQFWLSTLLNDTHFNDNTLVVNPCLSPEQAPTTFGCSHHQQLIHQLFVNTLRLAPLASDPDAAFLSSITTALAALDKGLHLGSWSQIQEWKMDIDVQNNTHRHLSHLIGWYPGASIASYADGYFGNSTIQDAVRTTLISRGPGIADANAGWEKVWRAACWARLNDSTTAYDELKLALYSNYAPNLLSMYSGRNEPFQIDANFGFVGAVVSMLVVDLPSGELSYDGDAGRTVVLGPAIPSAWGGGSVKGLRLRGGGVVDFGWDADGVVDSATVVKAGVGSVRLVNVKGVEVGNAASGK